MDINRIEPTIASTTAPIGGICLEYCGTQECPPGHMWEGYRKNYVIHTVLRGKGTFTAGGKTYQIGAGQAFAMFPGEFYHYTADMNDPWEYCWIGFEGFRCDAYVKRIGFEKRKCYVVSVPKPEEIWRKVTKITDYGSLTCLDEVRRLSLLLDVLAELMEGSSEAAEQQLDYPGSTYVDCGKDRCVAQLSDAQFQDADAHAAQGVSDARADAAGKPAFAYDRQDNHRNQPAVRV